MSRCPRSRSMSAIRYSVVLWLMSVAGSLAHGANSSRTHADRTGHPVSVRVEVLAMTGCAPRSGPAMHDEGGLALRVAADLPVNEVPVARVEHSLVVRLNRPV